MLVGEEFAFHYRIIADALDTVQAKSRISVHARDPLDPESGVSLELTGLTPVPEPGAPLLLGAGGAILAALARPRRDRVSVRARR